MGPNGSDHARARLQTLRALPLMVRRVIEARLQQLSLHAQELAGLAATVGRAFTFDVLRHASGADEETLVRGLDELWRRRIIREQGADAYDFAHDKIREAAYAALSSARRRLFHRKVAEALAAVHSADLDAVSGRIATHYEQAALPDFAIRYYYRAAEFARRVFANAEALDLLEHAIALVGQLPASEQHSPLAAQIYETQGDVLGVVRPSPPPLLPSRDGGGDAPGGGCAATVVTQLRERHRTQWTPTPFAQAPFRIHSAGSPSSVM